MIVKILTGHHLEFPSLKGGCTGSPESSLVKMPHCWKSHVAAQMLFTYKNNALCLQNSNLSSKHSGCTVCNWW